MPKAKIQTIDEYIESFPKEAKRRLQTLRQIVRQEAPDAQETIKYGMPTFTLHGNLVYFGAWKNHIGFYPVTAKMEANIDELSGYKTSGKGTIQFSMDKPLPEALIHKLVAFRVREQLARESAEQRLRQHQTKEFLLGFNCPLAPVT